MKEILRADVPWELILVGVIWLLSAIFGEKKKPGQEGSAPAPKKPSRGKRPAGPPPAKKPSALDQILREIGEQLEEQEARRRRASEGPPARPLPAPPGSEHEAAASEHEMAEKWHTTTSSEHEHQPRAHDRVLSEMTVGPSEHLSRETASTRGEHEMGEGPAIRPKPPRPSLAAGKPPPPVEEEPRQRGLGLGRVRGLSAAIVMSEILGPPKCLRETEERWM
ncbi:MAG: hypothetical protein AB1405_11965 [Bdellovibrionota bacterium]